MQKLTIKNRRNQNIVVIIEQAEKQKENDLNMLKSLKIKYPTE